MTTSEVPERSWELSHYEVHREAQNLMTDDIKVAVSSKSVHSDLRCPICLDLLSATMTTKECLHRFCSQCIITALRSGNKECPTCRKKLVSKRSLRPDPNFDQLIAKLFPDKEDCEEQQEKAGFAHAKRMCRKRILTVKNTYNNEEEITKKIIKTVQITLSPLRTVMKPEYLAKISSKQRFVETNSEATVEHLVEYLKTRITIELSNNENKTFKVTNVKLFLGDDEKSELLNLQENLEYLINEKWKREAPMNLLFSFDIIEG